MLMASCGNGSNDPLPVLPVADSTVLGSYLNINFSPLTPVNNPDATLGDVFLLQDLALNGVPNMAIHASTIYNNADSLWECHIQVSDATNTRMALDVKAIGSSPTGTYTVMDNSSTFTNYKHGENKNYLVVVGSQINITQSTYPIKGTMGLTLYYNHNTIAANDSFKIYN